MMNRRLTQEGQPQALWQRQQRHERSSSHDAPPKSGRLSEPARPGKPGSARLQTLSLPAKHAARLADKPCLTRDQNEFNRLLSDDPHTAPMLPLVPLAQIDPDALSGKIQDEQATSTSSASAIWAGVEPQLSQNLSAQELFPARFSLLLPQLGEINALVTTLPGGELNVALGFSAHTFDVVRGSERSCAESLARRMGQRVKLRFQRQETLS